MNAVFYPAVFHPEETGYSVTVPDIEGCFTQGDTMDEAVRMAQDAIGLMLEECAVCPTPSVPSSLPVEAGDFVVMVPLIWLLTKSSSALLKRPSPSPLGSMMQPRPHTSTSPAFFRTP